MKPNSEMKQLKRSRNPLPNPCSPCHDPIRDSSFKLFFLRPMARTHCTIWMVQECRSGDPPRQDLRLWRRPGGLRECAKNLFYLTCPRAIQAVVEAPLCHVQSSTCKNIKRAKLGEEHMQVTSRSYSACSEFFASQHAPLKRSSHAHQNVVLFFVLVTSGVQVSMEALHWTLWSGSARARTVAK